MSLAVISDLHIGTKARSKDLCPYDYSDAIEDGYIQTFLSFIQKQDLHADYLVIAGDVTHEGQPDEVNLASEVVSRISKAFGIQEERIVFVPGNHDADWEVQKLRDTTGFRESQRYDPLRDPRSIFEGIMTRGHGHICEAPFFSSWEDEKLLVVGYNSSSDDKPGAKLHHGSVIQRDIDLLEDSMSTISANDLRLKVFLVHHHPVQYSAPIPDDPDFSIMVNSENLLALLKKHRFDLLIHGHEHYPHFEIYTSGYDSPIPILCSGSFSAVLDPRWSGVVNNQFHIIRVTERDTEDKCVLGEVESWTYTCGQGWHPSEAHNGIEHKRVFGTYLLKEKLENALRGILEDEFGRSGYVDWVAILEKFPHFRYVPRYQLLSTLDNLALDMSFLRQGELPESMVLLRREENRE